MRLNMKARRYHFARVSLLGGHGSSGECEDKFIQPEVCLIQTVLTEGSPHNRSENGATVFTLTILGWSGIESHNGNDSTQRLQLPKTLISPGSSGLF